MRSLSLVVLLAIAAGMCAAAPAHFPSEDTVPENIGLVAEEAPTVCSFTKLKDGQEIKPGEQSAVECSADCTAPKGYTMISLDPTGVKNDKTFWKSHMCQTLKKDDPILAKFHLGLPGLVKPRWFCAAIPGKIEMTWYEPNVITRLGGIIRKLLPGHGKKNKTCVGICGPGCDGVTSQNYYRDCAVHDICVAQSKWLGGKGRITDGMDAKMCGGYSFLNQIGSTAVCGGGETAINWGERQLKKAVSKQRELMAEERSRKERRHKERKRRRQDRERGRKERQHKRRERRHKEHARKERRHKAFWARRRRTNRRDWRL